MTCRHPLEEMQRVFEGSAVPRTDRLMCGLCGELQYLAVRMTAIERDEWTVTYRTGLQGTPSFPEIRTHRSA